MCGLDTAAGPEVALGDLGSTETAEVRFVPRECILTVHEPDLKIRLQDTRRRTEPMSLGDTIITRPTPLARQTRSRLHVRPG